MEIAAHKSAISAQNQEITPLSKEIEPYHSENSVNLGRLTLVMR